MTTLRKVAIGGTGALMPIILNLLVVDYENLDMSFNRRLFGYAVRVVILFGLGGFVAYLHTSERQAIKLFQLGLGAPAVLLGMLNGFNAKYEGSEHSNLKAAKTATSPSWSLFESAAEAQEPPPQTPAKASTTPAPTKASPTPAPTKASPTQAPTKASATPAPAKSFKPAKASGIGEFVDGFLGRRPDPTWFVISGSHRTREAAQKQADSINSSRTGLEAEVYEPYGDSPYYAVVIGSGLTKSDALFLKQQAIQAGLPKDTFLWTF